MDFGAPFQFCFFNGRRSISHRLPHEWNECRQPDERSASVSRMRLTSGSSDAANSSRSGEASEGADGAVPSSVSIILCKVAEDEAGERSIRRWTVPGVDVLEVLVGAERLRDDSDVDETKSINCC